MSQPSEQAEEFVNTVFSSAGLDLRATVKETVHGPVLT